MQARRGPCTHNARRALLKHFDREPATRQGNNRYKFRRSPKVECCRNYPPLSAPSQHFHANFFAFFAEDPGLSAIAPKKPLTCRTLP